MNALVLHEVDGFAHSYFDDMYCPYTIPEIYEAIQNHRLCLTMEIRTSYRANVMNTMAILHTKDKLDDD